MSLEAYLEHTSATRADRLRWWQEARFGMVLHWGPSTELGCSAWGMNRELIPRDVYDRAADRWRTRKNAAREWARLAKEAGQKYVMFTTKNHDGFCLWDTQQTDYNSVRRGPERDLVREFVEACREFDLRIAFYYSLMDWHHPDAERSATDGDARRRFLDFTQGCVRELCSNYGKIDVLFYDMPYPLQGSEQWEQVKMNTMVRQLQPDILIHMASDLPEDYVCHEQHATPQAERRAYETTWTLSGNWGWVYHGAWFHIPSADEWHSVREIIGWLCKITAGGGNLLLDIGPLPNGSLPEEAVTRLQAVGEWLSRNGEAVYGQFDRSGGQHGSGWEGVTMDWQIRGDWTVKGNTGYYWCYRWPGNELVIAGLQTRATDASLLATGDPVTFKQTDKHLILSGLPAEDPDLIAGVTVIKLEFDGSPRQKIEVWEHPPATYDG